MRLTPENAHEYEGKTLESDRMLFHNYPLRVVKHSTMGWMYVDRFHVMMRIPEEGIHFDRVMEDDPEERNREMARSNYAAQLAGLGYGPDGMPIKGSGKTG